MAEGKTALVTGASSGIGMAVARRLAERKYDCILSARRVDRLEALRKELEKDHGVRAHVVPADLGERTGPDTLVRGVRDLGADVDLLVNNAGFGVYGPFVEQPIDRVMQMIELNLVSLTSLTHAYASEMARRRRGRVMQISSIGAYQPTPLYAVYSATKSYVLSFSAAVNRELRGTGVTVTTVCPGFTATEFHEVAEHPKPSWMSPFMMTADEVALVAVRATLKGRSVVTTGFFNKINALLVKLVPRSWATAVAESIMRRRA